VRFLAALGATGLSGCLYGLSFPPASLRPLAFVCLVPFLVALRGVGAGQALLLGFVWAEVASVCVADALPRAVSSYFLQPPLASWVFSILVWGITASLYTTLFAWTYRALAARAVPGLPLFAAAAWTAAELARGRLLNGSGFFAGNPWALIAYSQAGDGPLVQIASLTGVYGVSFVLAAANAGVADLVLRGRPTSWRAAARPLALGLVPALAAAAWGWGALRRAEGLEAGAPPVRVAVVQPNLDLGRRFDPALHARHLDEHLGLTLQAIEAGGPEIVFWPEGALPFHLAEEPRFADSIARVLAEGGSELVAGGPRADPSDPDRAFNSVFALEASGGIRGHYDKRILVPFAEHAPLAGLELARRDFGGLRSFAPGDATPPLPTRAGAAGILVCNEAMYPEVAASRARDGATYLVNPSNDTWIASPRLARMMLDLVRLRAVEERRWLVRASTSGPSAIVDPWGRVRVRSEPATRHVILGAIQPRRELSVYARVGDLFGFACGAAVLAAIALRGRRSFGAPRAAP
jgi:apolipoprotein N-acyltransferase